MSSDPAAQPERWPVKRYVPWPEEQGPPDGWPDLYVSAEDFDALREVAERLAVLVREDGHEYGYDTTNSCKYCEAVADFDALSAPSTGGDETRG